MKRGLNLPQGILTEQPQNDRKKWVMAKNLVQHQAQLDKLQEELYYAALIKDNNKRKQLVEEYNRRKQEALQDALDQRKQQDAQRKMQVQQNYKQHEQITRVIQTKQIEQKLQKNELGVVKEQSKRVTVHQYIVKKGYLLKNERPLTAHDKLENKKLDQDVVLDLKPICGRTKPEIWTQVVKQQIKKQIEHEVATKEGKKKQFDGMMKRIEAFNQEVEKRQSYKDQKQLDPEYKGAREPYLGPERPATVSVVSKQLKEEFRSKAVLNQTINQERNQMVEEMTKAEKEKRREAENQRVQYKEWVKQHKEEMEKYIQAKESKGKFPQPTIPRDGPPKRDVQKNDVKALQEELQRLKEENLKLKEQLGQNSKIEIDNSQVNDNNQQIAQQFDENDDYQQEYEGADVENEAADVKSEGADAKNEGADVKNEGADAENEAADVENEERSIENLSEFQQEEEWKNDKSNLVTNNQ